MKNIILFLIRFYQKTISPDHGFLKDAQFIQAWRCRFYPSCSEYARQAIEVRGVGAGVVLSIKRIFRCRPGVPGGLDPLQ